MKYDDFLLTLKNKVLPVPVFIPLTIKYLLENGPTTTAVLQRHYDDFLEQNNIPDPGEDPHGPTEDMHDLGLIHESIYDPIEALSLTLEDPDVSEFFKDEEDFEGTPLLCLLCFEKIEACIAMSRQKKTEDEHLADSYDKTKELFVEFLGKQMEYWYQRDARIVASSEQAARKKISEEYGPAFDPYGGIDPGGMVPNMKIFRMMDILIHSLRRFVQAVLRDEKDQDGKPWHTSDRYVPQAVLDRANQLVRESSQAKTTAKSAVELFLMCMDEGGLFEVVQKNWKKFFKNAFDNEQAILNHIGELKAIRDPNFHFRDMTADEQRRLVKKLEVYVVDILSYTELYAGR